MRRLPLILATFLLLTAAARPAQACINDREVNRAEREFRSQYLPATPVTSPATPPSETPEKALPIAFYGLGTVLLLGATASVIHPRKSIAGK